MRAYGITAGPMAVHAMRQLHLGDGSSHLQFWRVGNCKQRCDAAPQPCVKFSCQYWRAPGLHNQWNGCM